ncbi:Beta-galactosidase BoGH2A [Pontiella desulfatans]|uniref:Beta-galactosidase BoGH2A n=2 Tax=Pontiella desulfatans TaxID=2750659 RepID=A0A6C2TXR6_PONDE|nr:Beta-galactosidase BoGH2A [Pontiella desulfatans]
MISAIGAFSAPTTSRLENWRFSKADTDEWTAVTVPHTWNAADGHNGGTYYRGAGCYRTDLNIPEVGSQRVFLRFIAVGTAAEVVLDGQSIGSHLGGYSAFAFEITDQVKSGKTHDLRVKADNTHRPDAAPLSGDFTVCGGMHRPVELIVKNAVCISPLDHASPGVFIFQENVSREKAGLRVRTLIDNGERKEKNIRTLVTLTDAEGKQVAHKSQSVQVEAGLVENAELLLELSNPRLWHGIEDPYLYTLTVALFDGETEVDRYAKRVGLRYFHIDPEKGFFLNGESYPLHGVNMHQDRAVKGAAVSDEDIRSDFAHIREIGANCLRLAHYPHSSLSYEICDETGLLAWAEIPLVNQVTHDPGFAPNARQQLLEMVRQHNNHCSIFTWSLSNEMFHRKTEEPMELLRELQAICKAEDPARPTSLATNNRRKELCNLTDLVAFNNYPGWYGSNPEGMQGVLDAYNQAGGLRGVGVSEYGAGGSIRHQDLSLKRVAPKGNWHPEQWQAHLHERQYNAIMNTPACWGSFVWAMFDFSSDGRSEGDRDGVNDKGLMTHDRAIRKDAFYFYKAHWSKESVLHLTSKRYRIRNTRRVPVKVYSNQPEVMLSVNGKKIGASKPDRLKAARWENIELVEGKNKIVVAAGDLRDEAVWIFDPTAPTPGPAAESIVQGLFSASDAEKGHSPKGAFDGNAATRWATSKKGAWLAREFENPVETRSISIRWYKGGERNYSFKVETSTDGNTWRPAFAGKSGKQDGYETYSFDVAYELSHVRIICNGHGGGVWSSIVDVRLGM